MSTKKKLQTLAIFVLSFLMINSMNLTAQELDSYGEMERPKNVGNSDFDNFKNSSFDIYFNAHKLDKELKKIDENLVKYAADKENIDFESLRADIKALNKSKESAKELSTDLKALDDKSKAMVADAKNFKPRTKAPKAIKNTDKSIKALDDAKATLKTVSENQVMMLKTATELLGDN
ncbi:MAG: hypothetical protein DRJ10_14875 [Bacteroidetes bacterium]|nr:MAG: hypothetical protein DRJ10_14875 [Bacteroidota bacterium]